MMSRCPLVIGSNDPGHTACEERRAALEAQNQDQPAALQGPDPSYTEAFDGPQSAQQNGYDSSRNGFPEQQPAGYDQQTSYEEAQQAPYEEQRQTSYEEPKRPAYDEPYFAQNGGLPQNDLFSTNGGYPEPGYAEPVQEEPAAVHAAAPETFSGFEERRYQDDWPQPDGYRGGYADQYAPETESVQAADVSERDRVGFDRPGPAPATKGHELTDAGLPRRGSTGSSERLERYAAREPGVAGLRAGEQRRRRHLALGQRRAVAAGLPAPEAQGGRGHLLRSAAAGTQGQPGRGSRRIHPAGGPIGLPRPRGRPGQAEQPAPRGPAGPQRRQ
ncbi:hypothetical protein SVIOM74S_01896 [Streptomyces violarus]